MNTNTAGELIAQMPIALNTIQIRKKVAGYFAVYEIAPDGKPYLTGAFLHLENAIAHANELISEEMAISGIAHELFKLPFGDKN